MGSSPDVTKGSRTNISRFIGSSPELSLQDPAPENLAEM
jgi:hypothetical protein